MTEIEKLEELAKKATPGPWTHEYSGSGDFEIHTEAFERRGDRCIASLWRSYTDTGHFFMPGGADARFIAAANPQAILSLISSLREKERDLARVKAERDGFLFSLTAAESRAEAAEAELSILRERLAVTNAAEAVVKAAEAVLSDIKTVSVDMGGKHRYCMRHDAYKTVEPFRAAVNALKK